MQSSVPLVWELKVDDVLDRILKPKHLPYVIDVLTGVNSSL